jgi:hypothetical protein
MTTWTRHLYEHDPLAIAKGESNGYEVRNIFGYNTLVETSFIPCWENNTAYVQPTTGLNMTVTSNVSDNGVVIRIIGLDVNYEVIAENVTLNSAVPPTTTLQFFRINDVVTASGNAINSIVVSNGGVTYAKVRGGDGRNQASIYTVPAGYSFYLMRIDAFCATAAQNNRQIFFRNLVCLPNGVKLRVAETSFLEIMNIQREIPFRYNEKTDIEFQLRGSAGQQFISVFGEGVLVKNTVTGEP